MLRIWWGNIYLAILTKLLAWFGRDPATCDHDWHVISTVLSTVQLQVACNNCALYGVVSNPTEQEWGDGYHAPSKPYRWQQPERVEFILPKNNLLK